MPNGFSAMGIFNSHSIERRRTARVTLTVPLMVRTGLDAAYKFRYKSLSRSVSSYGASIEMDPVVWVGQTLLLVNETSGQSLECRVVWVRRVPDWKTYVGIAFPSQNAKFWHMAFPAPGARPLRRAFSDTITAQEQAAQGRAGTASVG